MTQQTTSEIDLELSRLEAEYRQRDSGKVPADRYSLFKRPGASFDFQRMTLAPPISRLVAPRAYWLAYILE